MTKVEAFKQLKKEIYADVQLFSIDEDSYSCFGDTYYVEFQSEYNYQIKSSNVWVIKKNLFEIAYFETHQEAILYLWELFYVKLTKK